MNKKWRLALVCSCIVALLGLWTSCGANEEDEAESLGSITGKALYTNTDVHSGILITLSETDGFMSADLFKHGSVRAATNYRAASGSNVVSTTTKADGSYSFTNVAPGTYTIYASSDNTTQKAVYRNITVKASESVTVSDLNLTATSTITGTITLDSATTGNGGILVFVSSTSYMAITGDDGSFTISDVPVADNYAIAIMKGSFYTIWKTAVNVTTTGVNLGTKDIVSTEIANGLIWKGSFASSEDDSLANPKLYWAYYNTTDGCSYIYVGSEWALLASAGAKGDKGDAGEKGAKGETGEAGAKGDKGDTGEKGESGVSIVWKGSFASSGDEPLAKPELYWAFFNTTDGCSYIYDGTKWTLLAAAGADGKDAQDASDSTIFVRQITIYADETVSVGESVRLWAYVYPANATTPTYTWSIVSGSKYANISEYGDLYVYDGYGETITVQCAANDGSGVSATQTITILPNVLEVGADKTYKTVQSAFEEIMAANATGTITVKVDAGTYEEMIYYNGYATIILEGTGSEEYGSDVVITYNNSGNSDAMKELVYSHGATNGNFRGVTRFDGSCNLVLKNITIQNTYSRAQNDGSSSSAEALNFYSKGNLVAYNSSFVSHHNTLNLGHNGGRMWFYKDYIAGDTDIIMGSMDVALFEECSIYCLGDESTRPYIVYSRAMVDAAVNKGIVLLNNKIEIASGVTGYYGNSGGSETQAAILNNTITGDGTLASTLYHSAPHVYVTDAAGDLAIGYKDYNNTFNGTLVDTSERLDQCGALSERVANREYSGRYVILNRGYSETDGMYKTASIWDISEYETEFNATPDNSYGQIFVEPVAKQKLVSGDSVSLRAYDIDGNDITYAVTWSYKEESNVTENVGKIVKDFDNGTLYTNRTAKDAVVNGTVTVTITNGDFTDTACISVIPEYIVADTVTLAETEGTVAQGNSIAVTGTISYSGDASAEVSDTTTVWRVSDPSIAMIFDKTNNALVGDYESGTCDVVIYGVKAGTTTIEATSANGGIDTYTVTVTDSTVYYLPIFGGVYVGTDVQDGSYAVWNGMLVDAVTNNRKYGTNAKMSLKRDNYRMQTRNVILNVPVTSDATIKLTLQSAPATVATADTASTYNYNGLYADGKKITYTTIYTDDTDSIDDVAYNALSEESKANYKIATRYYTICFDYETQAQTASLTDISVYGQEVNDLTAKAWCQIGPFGSSDIYITEISITPEDNSKYSY